MKQFGNYLLEQRLAIGGMGELYLASTASDRPLAVLKILHRDFLENPEYVSMFEDEGRIGARLAHPNIVGVHEIGRVGDVPFIVFEFVDGENLRTVLNACAEVDVRVPPELAVRIAVGVLLGLDHAHRARDDRGRSLNLVHRDLSPDNIVLSWDGDAKIVDFGIAKAEGRSTTTQAGILKGKSQYMAPEQAKGGAVDQTTDLFAVGLVLLEMLTGRKRFAFDDGLRQILAAQEWTAYSPSEYCPGLPVELDAIVLKSLERDPSNRFQTADAFAGALTRVLQQGMLPRSESLASFLRRLFPGRTRRAALAATDEPTLLPRQEATAARTPAPRTPAPTVKKGGSAGSAALPPPPSAEPTVTRDATGPERTETAKGLPFDDEDTGTVRRPALRDADAGDAPTREADRPTVGVERDTMPPPPRARVPGPGASAPRPAPGASRLRVERDEGVYDEDEFPLSDTPRPEARRPLAAIPLERKPRKSRRGLRVLLAISFFAAAAALAAEYRERLEAIPALALLRARLAGTPQPAETPAVVVVGSSSGEVVAGAEPSPSPLDAATPIAARTTPPPAGTPMPAAFPPRTPVPVRTAESGTTVKPASASVRVTSDPAGFAILLDGVATGKKTPAVVLVPPGKHVLSLDAPGYRPWTFEETFRAGDTLVLPAALIPE